MRKCFLVVLLFALPFCSIFINGEELASFSNVYFDEKEFDEIGTAMYLEDKWNWDLALAEYAKVLNADSNNKMARYKRALILLRLDEITPALQDLELLKDSYPLALLSLSEIYGDMGKKEEQIACLNKKSGKDIYQQSLLAELQGNLELAEIMLRKGKGCLGYYFMGEFFRRQEKYPEAIEKFNLSEETMERGYEDLGWATSFQKALCKLWIDNPRNAFSAFCETINRLSQKQAKSRDDLTFLNFAYLNAIIFSRLENCTFTKQLIDFEHIFQKHVSGLKTMSYKNLSDHLCLLYAGEESIEVSEQMLNNAKNLLPCNSSTLAATCYLAMYYYMQGCQGKSSVLLQEVVSAGSMYSLEYTLAKWWLEKWEKEKASLADNSVQNKAKYLAFGGVLLVLLMLFLLYKRRKTA